MTVTTQQMVEAVRAHASAHYNVEGWDYVVECWSDDDIMKVLDTDLNGQRSRTLAQALAAVRQVVQLLDERRREVTNEIF